MTKSDNAICDFKKWGISTNEHIFEAYKLVHNTCLLNIC